MVLIAAAWLAFAGAEPVCTKKATVLRKGPTDSAAISWRVPRYMPFMRVDKKGAWSKLNDLEGEAHWARAADVTNAVRCVVVKANFAALHRDPQPSSPAPELKIVDRYTPFLRVADQGDWMQVKDEAGHVAWLQAAQVWKPVLVNAISF